jgi:magnesium transporter
VFERPDSRVVGRLHFLKRLLIQIRRIAWPQRELLGALWRDDTGAITQEVKVFLRDGYDHAVQVMDIVESYRDMASGLMDMYMSSVSVKTNDVMRVLTVMSSIFIPLTFIAGIYGMNFEYMPELRERWGYFIALGAMVLVASGLLVFFRRKRWI